MLGHTLGHSESEEERSKMSKHGDRVSFHVKQVRWESSGRVRPAA
ncbi:hypothetical protein ACFPRL_16305 [Pseudoclavibacter helvolus]